MKRDGGGKDPRRSWIRVWSAKAVVTNGQLTGFDFSGMRHPNAEEMLSEVFRSGEVFKGRARYCEAVDMSIPCRIDRPHTDFCDAHGQPSRVCFAAQAALGMGWPSANRIPAHGAGGGGGSSGGGGSGGAGGYTYTGSGGTDPGPTGPHPQWIEHTAKRLAGAVRDLNNASPRLPTEAELIDLIEPILEGKS